MRQLTVILALLLLSLPTFGQGSTSVDEERKNYLDNATIYYRINESKVDPTYLTNSEALKLVKKRLTDTESINHLDSITLVAAASPDGPVALNNSLSDSRAKSLMEYLKQNYPNIIDKLRVGSSGEDWDGFRAMVVDDPDVPHRAQVLELIDSDAEPDVKEWRIKQLEGGESWSYLKANILPYLRSGASAIFHYDIIYIEKYVAPKPVPEPEPEPIPEPEPEPEPVPEPEPIPEPIVEEEEEKPLFALKTNLLYDIISVLNAEIEVPIKDHWSVAGEWTFPWWIWDNGESNSKRHRIQLLNATIEGKYWFGDRTDKLQLTGWHLGAYVSGGIYDFERSREGLQGEFYGGGLTGGYAHTINKKGNLRMEYSLAVGYFKTDYHDYEAFYGADEKWHPIRLSTNEFSWIGPTRARASLVWMLNHKIKKGGK
ncbi:MAG: DUF3575 domain-containing protein [Rikenellaceae bacterium]